MTPQELAELDLAVAKAEGLEDPRIHEETPFSDPQCVVISRWKDEFGDYYCGEPYEPTRDAALAMALLEKHDLAVSPHMIPRPGDKWWAQNVLENIVAKTGKGEGSTPCIAICKAVVALKGAK